MPWAGAGYRGRGRQYRHAHRCFPFRELVALEVLSGELRVLPSGFVGLGRESAEQKAAKGEARLADLKRRFPGLWLPHATKEAS